MAFQRAGRGRKGAAGGAGTPWKRVRNQQSVLSCLKKDEVGRPGGPSLPFRDGLRLRSYDTFVVGENGEPLRRSFALFKGPRIPPPQEQSVLICWEKDEVGRPGGPSLPFCRTPAAVRSYDTTVVGENGEPLRRSFALFKDPRIRPPQKCGGSLPFRRLRIRAGCHWSCRRGGWTA
jgi:hypothetical protein